jgi:uncharacterized protein YciI
MMVVVAAPSGGIREASIFESRFGFSRAVQQFWYSPIMGMQIQAFSCGGTQPMTEHQPPRPSIRYVVIHMPGPAWQSGVDFREQPGVADHVEHYRLLHDKGLLELGGPFIGPDAGGMMVSVSGLSRLSVEDFAGDDPAVRSGLLRYEIRQWYTPMDRSE